MSADPSPRSPKARRHPPILAIPVTGEHLILPQLRLLRLPEVKARTGFSRSEIYRRMAANPPTFPIAVKLGERASAWAEHEITAWCEARIAERDAKVAA